MSFDLVSVQIPPYVGQNYNLLSGLSAIYEDINSVSNPQVATLSIILQQNATVVGENVTLRVAIVEQPLSNGQPRNEGTFLGIFLVDPNGRVRGSFPSGKIQLSSLQLTSTIQPDELAAMQSGLLAYTFQIPQSVLSLGGWTIYVLGVQYYSGTNPLAPGTYGPPFSAWTAATFDVVLPSPLTPLWDVAVNGIGYLGTASLLYQAFKWVIQRPRGASIVDEAKKHRGVVFGVVAIAVYIILLLFGL